LAKSTEGNVSWKRFLFLNKDFKYPRNYERKKLKKLDVVPDKY
jgi:hypothetical protein